MKKVTKTKIDPTTVGTNPLTINDFIVNVNKILISKSFNHDSEGILTPSTAVIEYDRCTKIYNKYENRIFVSKLTTASKSLYLWLIYEIDANIDYIWINKNRYLEENDIKSINTYKSAINELVRYCVIYPMSGKRDVYWINPRLFFNGNRIKKYPKHLQVINDNTK